MNKSIVIYCFQKIQNHFKKIDFPYHLFIPHEKMLNAKGLFTRTILTTKQAIFVSALFFIVGGITVILCTHIAKNSWDRTFQPFFSNYNISSRNQFQRFLQIDLIDSWLENRHVLPEFASGFFPDFKELADFKNLRTAESK